MKNIVNYITDENITPFRDGKINEVESLIFSQMSYFDFGDVDSDICVRDFKQVFDADILMDEVLNKKDNLVLLDAIVGSSDWSRVRLVDHHSIIDDFEQEQFSASTFCIDEGIYFIAFSGTDFSFAGWKEDFNLSFMDSIPSQNSAVEYTREMMEKFDGEFYLGGHSKGGNLATFVLFNIDDNYLDRIIRVDNFDGPGLNIRDESIDNISSRIHFLNKYLPEHSVFGRIYEIENRDSTIVKTNAHIIFDHDPHTWAVDGYGFSITDEMSKMSGFVYKTLKDFNANLDESIKKDVLEDLYEILLSLEADDLGDIASNLRTNILAIHKSFKNQNPAEKEKLNMVRQALRTSISKNRPRLFGQ